MRPYLHWHKEGCQIIIIITKSIIAINTTAVVHSLKTSEGFTSSTWREGRKIGFILVALGKKKKIGFIIVALGMKKTKVSLSWYLVICSWVWKVYWLLLATRPRFTGPDQHHTKKIPRKNENTKGQHPNPQHQHRYHHLKYVGKGIQWKPSTSHNHQLHHLIINYITTKTVRIIIFCAACIKGGWRRSSVLLMHTCTSVLIILPLSLFSWWWSWLWWCLWLSQLKATIKFSTTVYKECGLCRIRAWHGDTRRWQHWIQNIIAPSRSGSPTSSSSSLKQEFS